MYYFIFAGSTLIPPSKICTNILFYSKWCETKALKQKGIWPYNASVQETHRRRMPWIVCHNSGQGITHPIFAKRGRIAAKGSANPAGRHGRPFSIAAPKGLRFTDGSSATTGSAKMAWGNGDEVDEAVQLDPQNGAWFEGTGPSRVCKAPRVDVNRGWDQVPKVRTASHIIWQLTFASVNRYENG